MISDNPTHRHATILPAITIFAVALNLRPIMAAVGPLVAPIMQDTGMNATSIGFLTTLPVFLMGLIGLFAQKFTSKSSHRTTIAFACLLIALASLLRLIWHDSYGLFCTASLGGFGIALIQALMPGEIKRLFPERAGTIMAFYTTGIMAGAAIAASMAAPLAFLTNWVYVFGLSALPALLAFIAWLLFIPRQQQVTQKPIEAIVRFSTRHYALMIFFGIGTGAYTLVLAWLPPYYVGLGKSAEISGYLLGLLTLTEVVAGFLLTIGLRLFNDKRVLLMIALVSLLIGLILLIQTPLSFGYLAIILMGIGIGALFPLSLIVTFEHAKSTQSAVRLVSLVQGGGYMIAAAMPFIAGFIRDHASSLTQAWVLMALQTVILMAMALRFSKASIGKNAI